VVAETAEAYHVGTLRLYPERSLDPYPRVLGRPPRTAVVAAALAAPEIQGALSWMRFPYVEVEEVGDRAIVHVIDARYARSRDAGFGVVRVEVDRPP
jgi:hypothetical protein